jgi:hypothetical protein
MARCVRGNSFCFPAGLYVETFILRGGVDNNMVHNGHHFILAFEGAICLGFARISMII